jgi:hypothetical protein
MNPTPSDHAINRQSKEMASKVASLEERMRSDQKYGLELKKAYLQVAEELKRREEAFAFVETELGRMQAR